MTLLIRLEDLVNAQVAYSVWANLQGLLKKDTLRGGMNSRPYGRELFIIHRAGHLALPKQRWNWSSTPTMYIFSITENRFEKIREIIVGVMTRRDVPKDGDLSGTVF
jgi:hypothetical protein